MNHMKEGTRHVYKIKYNYSITQIFWRELNKYSNEEMKPTYFFGGSNECVQKNAYESEQTSEMVNIQISHGRIVKKKKKKKVSDVTERIPVEKVTHAQMWKTWENLCHVFQQLWKQDKKKQA